MTFATDTNAFLVESTIFFALLLQLVALIAPRCTPLQTWRDIFVEDIKA